MTERKLDKVPILLYNKRAKQSDIGGILFCNLVWGNVPPVNGRDAPVDCLAANDKFTGGFCMIVKCQICGKEFKTFPSRIKNGNGKYCSRKCMGIAQRKRVTLTCPICGNLFYVKPSDVNRGRTYCSYKCSSMARKKTNKKVNGKKSYKKLKPCVAICQFCKQPFNITRSEKNGVQESIVL